jgi:hypothetical protein
MHIDVAKQVLEIAWKCSGELNWSVAIVQESADEADLVWYRKAVGRVLGELFTEIMMKVYQEHPELVPEGLK